MPFRPDPADVEWYVRTRMVLRYAGDPAKNHADAIVPYLDALLRMTIPVPVRGIGASISSDRTRVYADPTYRNANDAADNAACVLHEVAGHMFAGHLDRFTAGEFTNHALANVAGDLAANQMVFAIAARHPDAVRPGGVRFANADGTPLAPAAYAAAVRQTKWLHPLLYGYPEGLSMEEYYALLLKDAAQRERERQQRPDGSGGKGERGEKGEPRQSPDGDGDGGDEPSDDAEGEGGNDPQSDADDAGGSQGGEGSGDAAGGDSGDGDGSETDSGGQGSGGQGSTGTGTGGGSGGDAGTFIASARDPIADALGEGGVGKGACGACGGDASVSDRHKRLAEAQHGDLPEGASDTDLRAARKEVAAAVVAHAAQQGQGSVPAGLLRLAEGLLAPPKVRWERVLAGIVQGVVSSATAGQASATFARPSRRAPPGFVFPGFVNDRVDVAVVADTSGSMGDGDLRRVLSETRAVLDLPAVNRVWWIPTDASPDKAKEVRSIKAARDRLIGGGGTDMGAGLAEASNVRPRVPLTVVLTDGLTGWPKDKPRCGRVVVVLTRPSSVPTPEWVYRVVPAY
jgi:predicted metal-dependent peptidase